MRLHLHSIAAQLAMQIQPLKSARLLAWAAWLRGGPDLVCRLGSLSHYLGGSKARLVGLFFSAATSRKTNSGRLSTLSISETRARARQGAIMQSLHVQLSSRPSLPGPLETPWRASGIISRLTGWLAELSCCRPQSSVRSVAHSLSKVASRSQGDRAPPAAQLHWPSAGLHSNDLEVLLQTN